VIKISVREAKNEVERIKGLIGKKRAEALLLKTHFGIHTFGVKFPIDVLILNNENEVVSMKEDLKPNRIFLWNPIYENVIELPRETIRKMKIKIHNVVNLKII
jgi:uncharacterized protein